jgi:hypothetical protein
MTLPLFGCELFEIENARHGGCDLAPSAGFLGQVLAAFGRQGVKPRLTIVRGDAPFGGDPLLRFQPLQGGIERAVIYQEDVFGVQLNGVGDALAVLGSEDEDTQDQEVERPLQQSDAVFFFTIEHTI